jgi:hypothetical protein
MQPLQPDTSYHISTMPMGSRMCSERRRTTVTFWKSTVVYRAHSRNVRLLLMPNHFHLVVRIRKRSVIEQLLLNSSNSTFSKVQNFGKGDGIGKGDGNEVENNSISNAAIEKYLSKQFANLFSCYTQSFNKSYKTHGVVVYQEF